MTFRRPHITPPPPLKPATAIQAAVAAALLYPNPIPFNNVNLQIPSVTVPHNPPDQFHTDINKYKNPIPFGPYDYSDGPYAVRRSPPQPQPYNPNIYTPTVAVPFAQYSWPSAFAVPHATPTAFNLVRTAPVAAAPVTPVDFSKPFFPSILKDATQQTNINLFTNPIPFGPYDYSDGPYPVRRSLPQSQPYNPNLYTTVAAAPFVPIDFSKPSAFAPSFAHPQPYNIILFGQTLVPFATFLPSVQFPYVVPSPQPYNLNLFPPPAVGNPFIPIDWSRPVQPLPASPQAFPYNPNLFTNPIPFGPYDWNKPASFGSSVAHPLQLSLVLTANLGPWTQTDFSKPAQFPPFIPPQQYRNPLIFSGVPIKPIDLSSSKFGPYFQVWAQPYNVNLYVTITAAPFAQLDWSKPAQPLPAPPQAIPYNPNLFTNPIPFSQTDWNRPWRVTSSPPQPLPLNIELFVPPLAAPPFVQLDWSRPWPIAPPPPQAQPYPGALYQTPSSIIPNAYRLLVPHYLATGYADGGTIVVEGGLIPFGWIPTLAVDPMNAGAIQAFWNNGPRPVNDAEGYRDLQPFPIMSPDPTLKLPTAPVVYWVPVPGSPGFYQLTGAGASLGVKSA